MSPNLNMPKEEEIERLLRVCCEALDDKKADDIRILQMGEKCTIADYFIIATGRSAPHLKALHRSLETNLKDNGIQIFGKGRYRPSGWVVIDAIDVVVHVFSREAREFYALESLWKDAEILNPSLFITDEATAGAGN
ncbi:MAG: ribosome silencing factor [Opitutales bacterium]